MMATGGLHISVSATPSTPGRCEQHQVDFGGGGPSYFRADYLENSLHH